MSRPGPTCPSHHVRRVAALLRGCVLGRLPNGELPLIQDSNHDAIVRKPDDFNRVLLRFMTRH